MRIEAIPKAKFLVVTQCFIAIFSAIAWLFVIDSSGSNTKALCLAISLMWGPASIVSYLCLRLTKRKLVFVELVVAVQLTFSTLTLFLLMLFGEIAFDADTRDHIFRDGQILFIFAYFLFGLLVNASWLCGFLIRTLNLVVFLSSWHLILKHQVFDIYLATGAHIVIILGAMLLLESVIYLQVKA